MIWLVVAVMAAAAGCIQTVTGFGAVVLMMMVYPYFFGIIDAATLALFISLLQNVILCWIYRKHIVWKTTLGPTLVYAGVSLVVIHYLTSINSTVLEMALGIFLVILSAYFLIFARKAHLRPKPAVGLICGALSGITSGLFGIGGPPMALYFVSVAKDHRTYLACLQFLFALTGTVNLVGRAVNGIFRPTLLPYCLAGSVCMFGGMYMGKKINDRLNAGLLKTLVYVFVGVSGTILVLQRM